MTTLQIIKIHEVLLVCLINSYLVFFILVFGFFYDNITAIRYIYIYRYLDICTYICIYLYTKTMSWQLRAGSASFRKSVRIREMAQIYVVDYW